MWWSKQQLHPSKTHNHPDPFDLHHHAVFMGVQTHTHTHTHVSKIIESHKAHTDLFNEFHASFKCYLDKGCGEDK